MNPPIYLYDTDHVFVEKSVALRDPRASAREGHDVYSLPANATYTEPPYVPEGYIAIYDSSTDRWSIKLDFRHRVVYSIDDPTVTISSPGLDIDQSKYTAVAPPTNCCMAYYRYDTTSARWVPNENKKSALCDYIWELRKMLRDRACKSDLAYNGHLYHVDSKSLTDITLAAQQAIFSGDMTTTMRWVTADDTDVQVSGSDLVEILKQYGNRRAELVYQSNQEWRADLERTMSELVDLAIQLDNEYNTGGQHG